VLLRIAALALFVVPVAVALCLGALVAQGRSEYRSDERTALFVAFCVYIVAVGAATLAPPPMSIGNGKFGTNLVPLVYSFRCFIPNPGQPSTTRFCLETIIGNIALFVPLGAMLPLILRRDVSARSITIVALIASVSIESLQFIGRFVGNPRWSDVDDVIFNVAGAVAGLALFRLLRRHARRTVRAPGAGGIFES
jgi:Glycopeptide antibiotics resistance protein